MTSTARIILMGCILLVAACSKQTFDKIEGPKCNGSSEVCTNKAGYNYFDYSLVTEAPNNKTDILIVDDNSLSMRPEQEAMGNKFTSLMNELVSLDWRIAITTTDMKASSPAETSNGNLVRFENTTSRFLYPGLMSPADLYNSFRETIIREETGYGDERAIWAAKKSLERRSEFGFIRDSANLAVIILSDEDERSNGNVQIPAPPAAHTGPLEQDKDRPEDLINYVKSTWQGKKRFQAHAIIIEPILPDDLADEKLRKKNCKDAQNAQSSATAYYGDNYDKLARGTGGLISSVCADDYSAPLRKIGQWIDNMANGGVDLECTPDMTDANEALKIYRKLSNGGYIEQAYQLSGTRASFDPPLPGGVEIRVQYRCVE